MRPAMSSQPRRFRPRRFRPRRSARRALLSAALATQRAVIVFWWLSVSLSRRVTGTLSGSLVRFSRQVGPALGHGLGRGYSRSIAALERIVFPPMIAYAIYPVTICADLLLIPLLILFKDQVVLVLVANSYLNAFSVAVSSMVARQQKEQDQQLRSHTAQLSARHDAHDESLAALRTELLAALSQLAALQSPGQVDEAASGRSESLDEPPEPTT